MIDKETLLKTGAYEQPYQKEKDYMEELFLGEIYTSSANLVFKGGTAISKFYGSVRFSDDLDFSIASDHDGKNNVHSELASVVDKLSGEYPLKIMREKNNKDMLVYELSIRGPLFETLNRYQHLKIEVDRNASVIGRTDVFRRNPVYPDLKPYVAVVMGRKEILAEKVVALLFRHNMKARDLYDIYYLLQNGTAVEVSMIDRKMMEYGHTFTYNRLSERIKGIDDIWNKELRRLLPEDKFIQFGVAKEYTMKRFGDAGLI